MKSAREIVSCTLEDLADAFVEWRRRHPPGPGLFTPAAPCPPERHGAQCAAYFRELLREVGGASDAPHRRALAAGWWPPAPDSDRFWLHPEHGPVHEDDLEGLLDLEVGVATPAAVSGESPAEPRLPPSPERAQFFSPADYLTEALTRLGAAADTQDFNLGEVTLRFDEDAWEVKLKVELRITAERLDDTPAPGGAIGAPRPGTRMLDLQPPSSDPMKQAEGSIERLEQDMAGSARRGVELSRRSRRGSNARVLPRSED